MHFLPHRRQLSPAGAAASSMLSLVPLTRGSDILVPIAQAPTARLLQLLGEPMADNLRDAIQSEVDLRAARSRERIKDYFGL